MQNAGLVVLFCIIVALDPKCEAGGSRTPDVLKARMKFCFSPLLSTKEIAPQLFASTRRVPLITTLAVSLQPTKQGYAIDCGCVSMHSLPPSII